MAEVNETSCGASGQTGRWVTHGEESWETIRKENKGWRVVTSMGPEKGHEEEKRRTKGSLGKVRLPKFMVDK